MLIPGAKQLTTLDKTGFRAADGLSVEMKGMCIGSVMRRESEIERGAGFSQSPFECLWKLNQPVTVPID